MRKLVLGLFQSTYLYKVRPLHQQVASLYFGFNPRTYIRYDSCWSLNTAASRCFNPRTYIRYDTGAGVCFFLKVSFNPRTYIRYDFLYLWMFLRFKSFNPRTYIRYDGLCYMDAPSYEVSIHVPI